jgi:hypothetical protein
LPVGNYAEHYTSNGRNATPTWAATPGTHTIFAFVNELGLLQESNYDNNLKDTTALFDPLATPAPPPPAVGPEFDAYHLIDDFEGYSDKAALRSFWQTKGAYNSYDLDSVNKFRGRFGCTVNAPVTNEPQVHFYCFPNVIMSGMNALRMWIKPDGSNTRFSIFVKDNRNDQCWIWDFTDMLKDTDPFILQVPFARFNRVFRDESNRIFDQEGCREIGWWVYGRARYSIDDLMFVHDPNQPEYAKHRMDRQYRSRNINSSLIANRPRQIPSHWLRGLFRPAVP